MCLGHIKIKDTLRVDKFYNVSFSVFLCDSLLKRQFCVQNICARPSTGISENFIKIHFNQNSSRISLFLRDSTASVCFEQMRWLLALSLVGFVHRFFFFFLMRLMFTMKPREY